MNEDRWMLPSTLEVAVVSWLAQLWNELNAFFTTITEFTEHLTFIATKFAGAPCTMF